MRRDANLEAPPPSLSLTHLFPQECKFSPYPRLHPADRFASTYLVQQMYYECSKRCALAVLPVNPKCCRLPCSQVHDNSSQSSCRQPGNRLTDTLEEETLCTCCTYLLDLQRRSSVEDQDGPGLRLGPALDPEGLAGGLERARRRARVAAQSAAETAAAEIAAAEASLSALASLSLTLLETSRRLRRGSTCARVAKAASREAKRAARRGGTNRARPRLRGITTPRA